jgi:monoamine oxidase
VAVDRAAYCRDFLREVYGEGADKPRELAFFDWNEQPWIGGCVSATRPGLLTESGSALREPVGRIHWAGTERSTIWVNYIEGAVRAGQRAAKETLMLLSDTHPKELTAE